MSTRPDPEKKGLSLEGRNRLVLVRREEKRPANSITETGKFTERDSLPYAEVGRALPSAEGENEISHHGKGGEGISIFSLEAALLSGEEGGSTERTTRGGR